MNKLLISALAVGLAGQGIYANSTQWGNVAFQKSNINEDLVIMGSLSLDDVTVNRPTEVQGTMNTQNSIFKKIVTIYGSLQSNQTNFNESIYLYGDRAEFEGGRLNHLLIQASKNALVTLKNGVEIMGDIVFKGDHGTVVVDQSVVIHGKVIGATIRRV